MNKKLMSKILIWVAFMLYLLVFINVIILKDGTALIMVEYRNQISFLQKISNINFVPFKTIIPYLMGEPSVSIALRNILGNTLAFSPFGFFLPMLFKKCTRIKNIFLISLAISLFIEVLQFVFGLGSTDIDDIILNVLGVLLGFGVYSMLRNLIKEKVAA